MEITAEHAERQGVAPGQDVEERLFLDRVAGEGTDVPVGDEQRAVVVEADAADAVAAGLDEAAVAAGEALDVAVLAPLDERVGRGDAVLVQHLLQRAEALFFFEEVERRHRFNPF
jgi:hypothetical protein